MSGSASCHGADAARQRHNDTESTDLHPAQQEVGCGTGDRVGVSETTIRRWRGRTTVADRPHVPKTLTTSLSPLEEALVCELRTRLQLPLDDITEASRAVALAAFENTLAMTRPPSEAAPTTIRFLLLLGLGIEVRSNHFEVAAVHLMQRVPESSRWKQAAGSQNAETPLRRRAVLHHTVSGQGVGDKASPAR